MQDFAAETCITENIIIFLETNQTLCTEKDFKPFLLPVVS